MNQKQPIWSSLTAASLLMSTFGYAASTYASQPNSVDDRLRLKVSPEAPKTKSTFNSPSSTPLTTGAPASTSEVAKVGEYQSSETQEDVAAIATIHSHVLQNRPAVTLFVRDIPVLTFLGTTAASTSASNSGSVASAATEDGEKVGSTQTIAFDASSSEARQSAASSAGQPESHPVQRATAIAARLNQLHLNSVSAEAITVRWDAERQRYIIQVNGEDLVAIDAETILPDSTSDPATDALQATNRIRRLMGNAAPLSEITGRPQPIARRVSQQRVRPAFSGLMGMASWYGPGFHGNRSASGEVFNQNALTAAHRTLPFGTRVRVTNLRTGQSVVVRINDRGPFSRGRVIDLSAGAARVIGLVRSGTAPVRLDVLTPNEVASNP